MRGVPLALAAGFTLTITSAGLTISKPIPAPSAASAPKLLGTRVGPIALQMRGKEVLEILGEPQLRTFVHGDGGPQWEYAGGLVLWLGYHNAAQEPDRVWGVVARMPFDGATAEGFRVGDSEGEFERIYGELPRVHYAQPRQVKVRDARQTLLIVQFDTDGVATSLVLEDSQCYGCGATTMPSPLYAVFTMPAVKMGGLFAGFRRELGKSSCQITGNVPYPGINIQGTCETRMRPRGAVWVVSFIEGWDARDFRYGGSPATGQLSHTWEFTVDRSGHVLEQKEFGDSPPRLTKSVEG